VATTVSADTAATGRRREPFAIVNLTWIFALAATFYALGKVFSVSGLSPNATMLILRSTNLIQVFLGTIASDIQVTSFVILLLVLSLYMEAEWPEAGRSEREVNVLATMLAACSLVVLVVAAWPFALITLIGGTWYIAGRTGPLHFLAASGLLGERLKQKLQEQHRRSQFRRSLPDPVIDQLKLGETQKALALLHNAPSFAEEELKRLTRQYAPRTGIRGTQSRLGRIALALVSIELFGLLLSPVPWVPPEQLHLANGTVRTGYVLGQQGSELIIRWANNANVGTIKLATVNSRSMCQRSNPYRTLPSLLGIVKAANYPNCRDG